LPNLIPVATSKIGATFAQRNIPQQYTELNKMLDSDSYDRILWVPQKSRWGLASNLHPTVSASKLLADSWKDLDGSYVKKNNATTTDEISSMLQQNYMPVMMSNGGIKYVVVPMRDIANSDNFYRSYNDDPDIFNNVLANSQYLKKSDKQVPGFTIYETKAPAKPYFSSTTNLYTVKNSDNLFSAYDLVKDTSDPVFMVNDSTKATKQAAYTTDITDLFAGYGFADLKKGELSPATTDVAKQTNYYFDQSYKQAAYKANNTSITFQQNTSQQPISGSAPGSPMSQTIQLSKDKTYMLQTGDYVNKISRKSNTVNLGSPRADSTLYSVDSKNLLPQPDKTTGLWQKDPESCVPYGTKEPDISMTSQEDGTIDKRIIALAARDHAACTGPGEFAVTPGTYLWHFQYKGISAQFVSYQISFNNGQNITKDMPVADASWHTYDTVVTVPQGATAAKIRLVTRPSNQVKDTAMIYFADPQLTRLGKVAQIDTASGKLQKTMVQPNQITGYKTKDYHNQISNGSFEDGLWQKKVGDCNAFDKNADLKMSLNKGEASDGKQSLQLEAREHTACTNVKKIKVQGGSTYLFEFDYQSPNADAAGFNITMDDKAGTYIEEKIPIKGVGWHTYNKTVTLPSDVHEISLAVFAYSDDEDKSNYVINRYDNFALQEVPDIKNRFYAVSTAAAAMAKPKNITFEHANTTKKTVNISGATKPFILLMSEQYNPNWQLTPLTKGNDHLKVNGFQNAWYVQPGTLCSAHPDSCTKNADGSYDMHLSVTFTAQKWFSTGLIISVTTLLGCIAVAVIVTVARRRDEDTEPERTRTRYARRKH